MISPESQLEADFLQTLIDLKYEHRPDIRDRHAIEQIVDYKNDPGNGYTRALLCFVNNNARHFAFDADERFLRHRKNDGFVQRDAFTLLAKRRWGCQ